jgi:hypothetical protein
VSAHGDGRHKGVLGAFIQVGSHRHRRAAACYDTRTGYSEAAAPKEVPSFPAAAAPEEEGNCSLAVEEDIHSLAAAEVVSAAGRSLGLVGSRRLRNPDRDIRTTSRYDLGPETLEKQDIW